jgi:uncharacterized Zn finger protein
MEPTSASQPCPRCGGNLEIRHTIECIRTGAPVDFFRCEDCGCVHTVERRSADSAFSSDPLAPPEAVAKRKRA